MSGMGTGGTGDGDGAGSPARSGVAGASGVARSDPGEGVFSPASGSIRASSAMVSASSIGATGVGTTTGRSAGAFGSDGGVSPRAWARALSIAAANLSTRKDTLSSLPSSGSDIASPPTLDATPRPAPATRRGRTAFQAHQAIGTVFSRTRILHYSRSLTQPDRSCVVKHVHARRKPRGHPAHELQTRRPENGAPPPGPYRPRNPNAQPRPVRCARQSLSSR